MATLYEITKVCDADGCGATTDLDEIRGDTDDSDLIGWCVELGWTINSSNGDFCPEHCHLSKQGTNLSDAIFENGD